MLNPSRLRGRSRPTNQRRRKARFIWAHKSRRWQPPPHHTAGSGTWCRITSTASATRELPGDMVVHILCREDAKAQEWEPSEEPRKITEAVEGYGTASKRSNHHNISRHLKGRFSWEGMLIEYAHVLLDVKHNEKENLNVAVCWEGDAARRNLIKTNIFQAFALGVFGNEALSAWMAVGNAWNFWGIAGETRNHTVS